MLTLGEEIFTWTVYNTNQVCQMNISNKIGRYWLEKFYPIEDEV